MVNLGSATAKDVRALIALAQDSVWEKFHQRLEPEIGFIGEYRFKPNFGLRASYDLMWVTDLALAQIGQGGVEKAAGTL